MKERASVQGILIGFVLFFLSPAEQHGADPRGLRTTSFRQGEFGARTPGYLNLGNRGGGTIAAKRASRSSRVLTRCLARPALAYVTRRARRPSRRRRSRSSDIGGRRPYLHGRPRRHKRADCQRRPLEDKETRHWALVYCAGGASAVGGGVQSVVLSRPRRGPILDAQSPL